MAYYIELFDGDPRYNGLSMMEAITGAAIRIDVTNVLVYILSKNSLVNTDYVEITPSALNTLNVSYVALYESEIEAVPYRTQRIGAYKTIQSGYLVQFNPLDLVFRNIFVPAGLQMVTQSEIEMITEGGDFMVTG